MRILLDIIHADGIIDARETFFFNKMKEVYNLKEEDYDVVKKKNSLLALSQIKCFDNEQKEYFAKLMSRMIVIDEDVNVNEMNIYNIICEFCYINFDFNEYVEEGTGGDTTDDPDDNPDDDKPGSTGTAGCAMPFTAVSSFIMAASLMFIIIKKKR